MNFSSIDELLWASELAGEAFLLWVLLWRKRSGEFPAFTIQVAFNLAYGLGMVFIYKLNRPHLYASIYWAATIVDVLIQMAIVVELARVVLRPTGTWVSDARKHFFVSGLAGIAIAIACAFMVTPPATTFLRSFEVRGELFSSLLTCELVVATSIASNRLGLGWKNHVMAIGQGLMAWSVVAVVVDGLHSYFGYAKYFNTLEHARIVTYLGALGYWCVQLWRNEPERQPISPELRQYILALHHRVNYDLGEAEQ